MPPIGSDFLVACSLVLLYNSVVGKRTVGTPSPLPPWSAVRKPPLPFGDKKVAAPHSSLIAATPSTSIPDGSGDVASERSRK